MRDEVVDACLFAVVAYKYFGLGTFLGNDEDAPVVHRGYVAADKIDELYGTFQYGVGRDIQEEAVLCEQRVECYCAIVFHLGYLAVVTGYQIGVLQGCLAEAAGNNALGQLPRFLGCTETVAHQEIELACQVRHIAP